MKIKFEDIVIGREKILNSGYMEFFRGSLTVVKGENGSGKSLLMKKIFLQRNKEKSDIIYVDQSSQNILYKKSIIENIYLTDLVYSKDELIELLEKFDYTSILKHESNELSGGEKRLISILRGFSAKTNIIIFDEPTNELDYKMVEILIDLITRFKSQMSIICITHDDRIERIADRIYEIRNNNLNLDKFELKSENDFHECYEKRYIDRDHFIRSVFKLKKVPFFLGIIVIATMIYSMIYIKGIYDSRIPLLDENQIDIYIPTSTYGSTVYEGAIPIEFFRIIKNPINASDATDLYLEALNDAEMKGVTFGLYSPNETNYDWYKIELYDINTDKYYVLPEIYMNTENNTSLSIDILDTSSYFILNQNYQTIESDYVPMVYRINIGRYNEIIDSIYENESSNNIKNAHIIISADDNEDFYNFINSEYFESISLGNYYIRSNETIMIYNSIQTLQHTRIIFMLLGFVLFFIILLEIVFDLLFFKEYKNDFKVFVNAGVNKKCLSKNISKKYNVVWLKPLIIISLFLLAVIEFIGKQEWYIILLVLAMTILGVILQGIIAKMIFRRKIKHIYSWRFR